MPISYKEFAEDMKRCLKCAKTMDRLGGVPIVIRNLYLSLL